MNISGIFLDKNILNKKTEEKDDNDTQKSLIERTDLPSEQDNKESRSE